MGSINLQGLIDEVLGMVRNRQQSPGDAQYDEFKKRQWLSNEAHSSDIRKRNTLLETGQQAISGANELEGIKNTGAMARQQLIEGTKMADTTNNYNASIYKTDTEGNIGRFKAQTDRIEANRPGKGILNEQINAAKAVLESTDPGVTPELRQRAIGVYNGVLGAGGQQTVQPAIRQSTSPQQSRQITTLPGSRDDGKDLQITPSANRGAQSMTFDTDMGTAGVNPERERASAVESFYKLNPQLKKKREGLFPSN
jgi:hypothetical protein